MATLGCGQHTGVIYDRGGTVQRLTLDSVMQFQWERVRDAISNAQVRVSADAACCGALASLTTGFHELHLFRDGVKVWEGVIARIEYETDQVSIFAEDMLWVAKNTVLAVGYNKAYPNIAKAGYMMNWLMKDQTYAKNGDPWKMVPHLHWIQGSDDASTSAAVKAWAITTWEDFDKYAEDRGMDYTVAGRDIYFWDTHLKWRTLASPLVDSHMPEGVAIVEYGNEFATRVIVTNGNGYASQAVAPAWGISKWGYIDHLVSTYNEAAATEVPTADEKAAWQEQAQSMLDTMFPAPVRVRVPENSILRPEAPFDINDLIAGSWVNVVSTRLCRGLDQWHKIDKVSCRQQGGSEEVSITTVAAPENVVEP